MKKILFLAALFFTTICYAQEAGQKWIGGSFSISTSKFNGIDDSRDNSFRILPEIGFQISEKWGMGVSLGYTHTSSSSIHWGGGTYGSDVAVKSIMNGVNISPFARYTFCKFGIVGIFSDMGIGYDYGKYAGEDTERHRLDIGFRPGIKLNVTSNFALTAKLGFLGYQYDKLSFPYYSGEPAKKRISSTLKIDLDMSQIFFGAFYVF